MAPDGQYFQGIEPRVLGTNPRNPEAGRIFVWTKIGWFERVAGPSGNVAFALMPQSENELRNLISQNNPSADLFELDAEYRDMVIQEFNEQTLSYGDVSEFSEEDHPEEDSQLYHQHDL